MLIKVETKHKVCCLYFQNPTWTPFESSSPNALVVLHGFPYNPGERESVSDEGSLTSDDDCMRFISRLVLIVRHTNAAPLVRCITVTYR